MKKTCAGLVDFRDCDWKKIVKGKWLLLDANTIINLIKYNQNSFIEEINELGVELITIQPILLELNRTNSRLERLRRNNFIKENVGVINLDSKINTFSITVQQEMWLDGYYPETEDIYLAATIKKHKSGNTLLATSNLNDFREPLFVKNGFFLMKDEKSVCVISLLSYYQVGSDVVIKK